MATPMYYPEGLENEPGTFHVRGTFLCDNNVAVATATSCGKGVTYISGADGTYTLTFADKYKTLVDFSASVVGDNTTLAWLTSCTPSSSAAVISVGTTKGTPADINAHRVYFHFVFKKTTA